MAVWTIAAQEGTGGERIAAELAAAAGVPLLDRGTLAVFAHELDPDRFQVDDLDGVEERFAGRLSALAFSMGLTAGPAAAAAAQELQLLRKLPDLGRAVLGEAARRPCVILAPAAFAALQEHPAAIHVRLRAPLEWRIAAYRREHLVDRHCAEKALKHDEHCKHAWVKSLYRVDVDDARLFSVVLDASRFSSSRLVDTLVAAGGARAAAAVSP